MSGNFTQQRLLRLASTAPAWCSGIAILAGVLAFFPSAARAANAGWYAGIDAGQSRFTSIGTLGSPIYGHSFSSTDNGYRLSAGYQINSYFGLEVGYVNLGKVAGSNVVYLLCTPLCTPLSESVNTNLKTHGWILEFVGRYPFNDSWAVFARAGGIQAYSELNADYTPNPPLNVTVFQNSSTTSSDLDVTYGLGVQWSFAGNWAARLSWDRYVSLGYQLPMGGFNINLTSIGMVYRF